MDRAWIIYGLGWMFPWTLISAYIGGLVACAPCFRQAFFDWPPTTGERVMQLIFWSYLASGLIVGAFILGYFLW